MSCWCLMNETEKFKLGHDQVEVDPKDMTMDACGRLAHMARYSASDVVMAYYFYRSCSYIFNVYNHSDVTRGCVEERDWCFSW